jgi:hypothetical protein
MGFVQALRRRVCSSIEALQDKEASGTRTTEVECTAGISTCRDWCGLRPDCYAAKEVGLFLYFPKGRAADSSPELITLSPDQDGSFCSERNTADLLPLVWRFVGPLLLLWSRDNLNTRDRMHLPSGRSPVVCTTRIRILRRICVLRVKGHPTPNRDPLVKNLLA